MDICVPTLLFLSFLSLYVYLRFFSSPNNKSSPIHGFKNFPFLGSLPVFLLNRHRFLDWTTVILRQTPTHSAVFKRPGKIHGVITANPLNVEHILKTNFENYPKGERFISLLEDFLGRGIFNSDGEIWKIQRKTASYEFNTKSLRNFVMENVEVEINTRLIPILGKASETERFLDLQDVLERFAFDNVCKLAFGFDPACLGGDGTAGAEFMRAFEDAATLSSGRDFNFISSPKTAMVETRRSAKKEKLPMNSGEEETNDGDENSTLKGSTDSEQKTPEKDTSEDVTKDQIGTPSSSSRRNKKRSQGPCLIQPRHAWQKDQKVNVYSKTKLLGVLHKKMSDKQRRVMKNSFLWNFWELPTANFPTQLLLQIIRRRVHNDDKSLLTFNICGYTVDFTMEDFAIITGLICDDIKFTNLHKLPTSSIEKKFFKTHTVHSLKALLEEIDDYDFHNDKMSIKVAKLAMLESIVIANQQKNTISDLHFRLVEDDDSFESYPWGRISYDMLRQSVTRAVGSNTSLCMAVSGCAYALIYWAFERIPALSIGEKYARRISYDEPRLLAWDVMRHGTCKELDKDVFNDQIVVHEMRPVENPEKCYYLTEFQQMKKRKGKSVEQEVHVQKTDVLGSSNTDEEAQSISNETSNVPGYTKLNKKLDKISTAVAALAKRVEFIADIVYMRYLNDEKERRNVDKEKDGKKGTMSDNEREGGTNSKDGRGENEEGTMGDAEGDNAGKNIHGFHENEDRADSQADVHVGRNDTMLGDVIVDNKDDKKGTEVEELREEQPPFDPIDELVTNIVADLAADVEHIMEDPPEHNDDLGSQEILTKQREQADLETENIAVETVDNVAAVVDDTLATQETGLLTSKRPCRAKNLGQYFKEPYTDAFGSSDPKGKKPAKKRRSERTGKAVTGKATKKGKLKGVQTEQTDVETHKPSEENEPGFDINLTATVNEIRAEKENK